MIAQRVVPRKRGGTVGAFEKKDRQPLAPGIGHARSERKHRARRACHDSPAWSARASGAERWVAPRLVPSPPGTLSSQPRCVRSHSIPSDGCDSVLYATHPGPQPGPLRIQHEGPMQSNPRPGISLETPGRDCACKKHFAGHRWRYGKSRASVDRAFSCHNTLGRHPEPKSSLLAVDERG